MGSADWPRSAWPRSPCLPVAVPRAAHTAAATVAFISLAVWPAFAWVRRRRPEQIVAAVLEPRVSAAATCALLLTLAWFFAELLAGGQKVGLAERVAAGAQALWPLVVVLSVRKLQPNLGTVSADPSQT